MPRATGERKPFTPPHIARPRTSALNQSSTTASPARAAAARRDPPRLRFRVLVDTVRTYLTLFSALLLPLLLIAWGRSYMVNDRFYRADDGVAMVAGVANGEVALWAGPTIKDLDLSLYRSRQSNWGQSSRRTFQRIVGRNHVWFAGFGFARSEQIPWRDVPLTGRGFGVSAPLWFFALLVGALPCRLLARNMQSSEEFLAEREAEKTAGATPAT